MAVLRAARVGAKRGSAATWSARAPTSTMAPVPRAAWQAQRAEAGPDPGGDGGCHDPPVGSHEAEVTGERPAEDVRPQRAGPGQLDADRHPRAPRKPLPEAVRLGHHLRRRCQRKSGDEHEGFGWQGRDGRVTALGQARQAREVELPCFEEPDELGVVAEAEAGGRWHAGQGRHEPEGGVLGRRADPDHRRLGQLPTVQRGEHPLEVVEQLGHLAVQLPAAWGRLDPGRRLGEQRPAGEGLQGGELLAGRRAPAVTEPAR